MTADSLIAALVGSRAKFLLHVAGVTQAQAQWKPFPGCMSIEETLRHLMVDDLAATESLASGGHPAYESRREEVLSSTAGMGLEALIARLGETHGTFIQSLRDACSGKTLDDQICVWGEEMPIGLGVPFFGTEDSYHSGQVAFIRMAQDPEWDYYAAIYGEG